VNSVFYDKHPHHPVLMDATEKIPGLNSVIEKIQDSISGQFIIDSLMARLY
jgi:hypothetical protein